MTAAAAPERIPSFSLDYLDRSVDPGRDFYGFATGRWQRENPVPPDKSRWGAFDELRERNRQQLRRLAEEAVAADGRATGPRAPVATFYASALDRTRRDALGFTPLESLLRSIDAIGDGEELFQMVARLHDLAIAPVFEPAAEVDFKDSSNYALYLGQGGLSLPDREYYLSDGFASVREEYRRHVGRIFALAGSDASAAERSAEAVLGIETELARASRSRAETRDVEKNYHRLSLEELSRRYPGLPWAEYLRVRSAGRGGYVVVRQPEFFEAVERLAAGRSVDEWRQYLRWNVLHGAAPTVHSAAEAEDFGFFHRTLQGQARPEPDWELAVLATDDLLGEALGQLYVERYFPPEARRRMAQLIADLTAVFRGRLERLDWMTEATRRRALAKFDRFVPMIGGPDRYRDYSAIALDRGNFAANCLRAREFEIRRRVDRIGGPVDREEWRMSPPTVNAYYHPSLLRIAFPAGILQPPFFDVSMDDAVNYGSIGAVIGHEITHGFDDQGRRFDERGNLSDWWVAADESEFGSRAKEVEREYDRLEALPGLTVNGQLTLGENIADIGGVSIALEALERRLAADPSRDRPIDGFTPRQRFFLAWAQSWRSNVREEEARRRVAIDPHSPGQFRAVVPLTHLPEFFEAFPRSGGSATAAPGTRIW